MLSHGQSTAPHRPATWVAVVPVKPLPAAKTRLRGAVPVAVHPDLVLAMARDTATAVLAWPMVLLVVAVGGFAGLGRVDLILATIARTFLPYVAVCLLVGATAGLNTYSDGLVAATLGRRGGWIVASCVAAMMKAYFGVASMRIVGLYYHHFKHRFAWSWE